MYERIEGAAFAAAVAANEAFARARHCNKALDDQLTERDEQARISLDHAYTLLKGKLRAERSPESSSCWATPTTRSIRAGRS